MNETLNFFSTGRESKAALPEEGSSGAGFSSPPQWTERRRGFPWHQVRNRCKPWVEQSLLPGCNPSHELHPFNTYSSNLIVQGEGPVIPLKSLGDYVEARMPGWKICFSFALFE